MGALLNCKPSSEESRASALRVYHIAISQRVSTCKPTGCEFTTLRVSTCEPTSLRVANLQVNNFQGCEVNLSTIKCNILNSMPSIFLVLYFKILHIFTFLSDIYSAVDMCKSISNHPEVLYENSCSKYFGKYTGKHPWWSPTSIILRKGLQLY